MLAQIHTEKKTETNQTERVDKKEPDGNDIDIDIGLNVCRFICEKKKLKNLLPYSGILDVCFNWKLVCFFPCLRLFVNIDWILHSHSSVILLLFWSHYHTSEVFTIWMNSNSVEANGKKNFFFLWQIFLIEISIVLPLFLHFFLSCRKILHFTLKLQTSPN